MGGKKFFVAFFVDGLPWGEAEINKIFESRMIGFIGGKLK